MGADGKANGWGGRFKPLESLRTWGKGLLKGGMPVGVRRVWSILLLGVGLWVLYWAGGLFYTRIDLTEDGRYTLTPLTQRTLQSLPSRVYVKVYLGGDLPLEFQRLRQGVTELLEEYRVHSDYRVVLSFEDPNALDAGGAKDEATRKAYHRDLIQRGVQPISVRERKEDGSFSERLVFPALAMGYQGRTLYRTIYQDDGTRTIEQNINTALEGLEYQLTSMLEQHLSTTPAGIGFLQGHGELPPIRMAHWLDGLSARYHVYPVDSLAGVGALDTLRALVVAHPTQPFSEREKLILDQYVMQGGSLLLMLSSVQGSQDSLQVQGSTLLYSRDINLDDMLFRWGIRLPYVVLQDAQCAVVPINTALAGQPARFSPFPWVYYPLLHPSEGEEISRNINGVYSRFPGVVELVNGLDRGADSSQHKGLYHRVLLTSSAHARIVPTPRLVELAEIQRSPRDMALSGGPYPVVVAVEGHFSSLFKNRPLQLIAGGEVPHFLQEGEGGHVVVSAYGALAENDVVVRNGQPQPLPLGFDKYTQRTFGNKEFLDNIMLYLSGKEELLQLRGRERTMRLLDGPRLYSSRALWSVVGVGAPLLLLLLFGFSVLMWRRVRNR